MSSNLWTSSDCKTCFSWLLQFSRLQHDKSVHVCLMTHSSSALGDSRSCHMVPGCSGVPSSQLTKQLTDLLVPPCSHEHRGWVHKPFHWCSAVGVTRPGCTVAALTWPPKAIENQLSHQTKLSKLFLCLEMVAQRGKAAAYKPLSFLLAVNFSRTACLSLISVLEKVYPRNQG